VVYAIHILPPYIYLEYTWYIPTIYLVGVPDVGNSLQPEERNLNGEMQWDESWNSCWGVM
jgi:hypothetical protein